MAYKKSEINNKRKLRENTLRSVMRVVAIAGDNKLIMKKIYKKITCLRLTNVLIILVVSILPKLSITTLSVFSPF